MATAHEWQFKFKKKKNKTESSQHFYKATDATAFEFQISALKVQSTTSRIFQYACLLTSLQKSTEGDVRRKYSTLMSEKK